MLRPMVIVGDELLVPGVCTRIQLRLALEALTGSLPRGVACLVLTADAARVVGEGAGARWRRRRIRAVVVAAKDRGAPAWVRSHPSCTVVATRDAAAAQVEAALPGARAARPCPRLDSWAPSASAAELERDRPWLEAAAGLHAIHDVGEWAAACGVRDLRLWRHCRGRWSASPTAILRRLATAVHAHGLAEGRDPRVVAVQSGFHDTRAMRRFVARRG